MGFGELVEKNKNITYQEPRKLVDMSNEEMKIYLEKLRGLLGDPRINARIVQAYIDEAEKELKSRQEPRDMVVADFVEIRPKQKRDTKSRKSLIGFIVGYIILALIIIFLWL